MSYNLKYYCKDCENIENYDKALKDNFKGWEVHHRKEAEFSRKELITLGMYYNVSSEELIFLTRAEHNKLHKKDKHHTDETRRKISAALKGKYTGKDNPFYGKKHSEEHNRKISEAMKGNTYAKGMHWYNNGKENKYCYECPPGFIPGMLK